MNNTTAHEILERNEAFLKTTVSAFMRRCSQRNRNGVISREDLMQEVALSFLAETEKHGEEQARRQRITYIHVMYSAVIRAYPLSVPKRTSGFKNITAKQLTFSQWESMAHRISVKDFTAKTIERLSIQERLEGLSERDRKIIRWRLEGMTQREIAKRIGLTDVQMCREMKRIRDELMRAQ